ncbi:MAG: 1-acyl-sn-glycerol-3-phosphate acyltransferase [Oscillospiraceae bacterium]|nr:1-acyl-sn-glycerol-3-phosphate acyltransferase [Oscillospiraceae bacterium]
MSLFYAIVKFILYIPARLLLPVKIIGREHCPKEGGVILCCNHTVNLDPVYLIVALRRQIYFMGKEELFKNPFARLFFKGMNVFAIKRGTGDTVALDNAVGLVKNGRMMGIFPEGTRSKTGEPGRARSGVAVIAHKTGAPVLPAAMYMPDKHRFFRRVVLRFGPPIPTGELRMESETPSEFRRVSSRIMRSVAELWEQSKSDYPAQR